MDDWPRRQQHWNTCGGRTRAHEAPVLHRERGLYLGQTSAETEPIVFPASRSPRPLLRTGDAALRGATLTTRLPETLPASR